jgi:hypothetical protein
VKPMIIYSPIGGGDSNFAAKLCAERGYKLFDGLHMEALKTEDEARAFFHTAKPGYIATLQATSLEAAQARFKKLVGNGVTDLSRFEFIEPPTPTGMPDTAITMQTDDRHKTIEAKVFLDKRHMAKVSVPDLEIAVKHLSQHVLTEECGEPDAPAIERVRDWLEAEITSRNVRAVSRETGVAPAAIRQRLVQST